MTLSLLHLIVNGQVLYHKLSIFHRRVIAYCCSPKNTKWRDICASIATEQHNMSARHTSDLIFTARRYAKRGICRRRVSVCVCVSVTLRYCIKTAERSITQITPHDSSMTLVFWRQRWWRNSNGITSYGGDKCKWRCFRWPWVTPNHPNHLNFCIFVAFHIFVARKHVYSLRRYERRRKMQTLAWFGG